MSDEKKIPNAPPPDDYSKTTPNVNIPGHSPEPSGASDWNKTNYNYPKQPSSEEWGHTVANIKPIDTGGGQDFDKTFFPGAKQPAVPEWGMTEARTDLADADFRTGSGDSGGQEEGYGKTTPYFTLPEAERAKYQNLPPTPSEQASQAEQAKKAKGGVPGWIWALLALFGMFFVMVIGIAVVYFVFIRTVGFTVVVKGAPPGSAVRVDDKTASTTAGDGTLVVRNVGAGERVLSIYNPTQTCDTTKVKGNDGETREWIVTGCKGIQATASDDCTSFQPGEFDKAERCYNKALDELPDPFTAEQLINALNILIINFDVNKHDVPPVRLAALQKGATFIKKLQQLQPSVVLEIGGHTDSDGSDGSNMALSQRRADAVKQILVGYGVNAAGLQTRGYGETQAKFDNNTPQGKFLNRRIQYSVVKK